MYIKLEEIVNDLLIEEGKTSENDFLRYFKLGLNGLKELHFDVGGNIKTVELTVDSNTLTVNRGQGNNAINGGQTTHLNSATVYELPKYTVRFVSGLEFKEISIDRYSTSFILKEVAPS